MKDTKAAEKEKSSTAVNIQHRMTTIVNDWEDFNWGSAWPATKFERLPIADLTEFTLGM